MASIFSRIISGEIPAYKIAENQHFFAFLDIHPLVPGHTLVVPRQEVDELFDLPEPLLAEMLPFARHIATALKDVLRVKRVGLSVMGFEVPHAHLHLLPVNSEREMSFLNPKLQLSAAAFQEIQQKIVAALNR